MTEEQLVELMDANGYEGTWLTAEQCIECGLADELAAYDIDPQEAMRRLQEAQAKTDAAPQQATAYARQPRCGLWRLHCTPYRCENRKNRNPTSLPPAGT